MSHFRIVRTTTRTTAVWLNKSICMEHLPPPPPLPPLIKTFADNVIWCRDRCYCHSLHPYTSNRKYLLKWHIIQHLHAPNLSIPFHSFYSYFSCLGHAAHGDNKMVQFGSCLRKCVINSVAYATTIVCAKHSTNSNRLKKVANQILFSSAVQRSEDANK